jgi:threonylcarbamoyladenosine tRNA methylthiotransferase MtaB
MDTFTRLHQLKPEFTFTTDVIVGFPGETDRDFEETLSVMQEVSFAKVHAFPYSPRPRTRAALYPNQTPPQTIRARQQTILHQAEQSAYQLREGYIGKCVEVLTEHRDETQPERIGGHTDNFLMVWIDSTDLNPNQLVQVELIENRPEGLIGRVIGA